MMIRCQLKRFEITHRLCGYLRRHSGTPIIKNRQGMDTVGILLDDLQTFGN